MEPMSDEIVCDNSTRFSERTFIRMMTSIMLIVIAKVLPTAGKNIFLKLSWYYGGVVAENIQQ